MGRVVVDELVVALRLDDSQFDAAVAEAIAARQKLADESVKAEAKESSAIAGMAKRYLSLYAVIKLVGSAYAELLNVSEGLLQLSNESRRLGMAAHGLRTWQNAFEMLGGSAGDATSEIQKFTDSINALIYKGDVGENLQWLNRLGITPQRGMTYEDTAQKVFTGIQAGLASGTIKTRQEAGYLARQAGFGGVGEFITQNPNSGLSEYRAFIAAAEARAAGNATASSGAAVGRNTIRNAQELQLTKEGVVGRQAGRIMSATNVATDVRQAFWKGGEWVADIAAGVVNVVADSIIVKSADEKTGVTRVFTDSGDAIYFGPDGKALKDQEKAAKEFVVTNPIGNKPSSNSQSSGATDKSSGVLDFIKPRVRRVTPEEILSSPANTMPAAPPTPNVSQDNSRSSSATINQTINIRSTDPSAAGRSVGAETRKAVNAQADGAGR